MQKGSHRLFLSILFAANFVIATSVGCGGTERAESTAEDNLLSLLDVATAPETIATPVASSAPVPEVPPADYAATAITTATATTTVTEDDEEEEEEEAEEEIAGTTDTSDGLGGNTTLTTNKLDPATAYIGITSMYLRAPPAAFPETNCYRCSCKELVFNYTSNGQMGTAKYTSSPCVTHVKSPPDSSNAGAEARKKFYQGCRAYCLKLNKDALEYNQKEGPKKTPPITWTATLPADPDKHTIVGAGFCMPGDVEKKVDPETMSPDAAQSKKLIEEVIDYKGTNSYRTTIVDKDFIKTTCPF